MSHMFRIYLNNEVAAPFFERKGYTGVKSIIGDASCSILWSKDYDSEGEAVDRCEQTAVALYDQLGLTDGSCYDTMKPPTITTTLIDVLELEQFESWFPFSSTIGNDDLLFSVQIDNGEVKQLCLMAIYEE